MPEGQSNAIQISIYTKLVASTELTNLLSTVVGGSAPAIYDDVTQAPDSADDSYFPYLVIGDDIVEDWSTDTSVGGDAALTIHVWSRADAKRETKLIYAAIKNAINRQTLTTPDHEFLGCDFVREGPVIIDPDMETFHGTCDYRIIIDEVGYGD